MAKKFSIPKQPTHKNIQAARCEGATKDRRRCSIGNISSMIDVENRAGAALIRYAPECLKADLRALLGMPDAASLPSRFVSLWPELIRTAPPFRHLEIWDQQAMAIAYDVFGCSKCCLEA